jgi:hypothetical protein
MVCISSVCDVYVYIVLSYWLVAAIAKLGQYFGIIN